MEIDQNNKFSLLGTIEDPELEEVAKVTSKKRKKEDKKLKLFMKDGSIKSVHGKAEDHSFVDVYGHGAVAQLHLKLQNENDSFKLRDIQNVILWILGEGINPLWVFVKNKPLIPKIVMVLVNSINRNIFNNNKESLPFLVDMTSVNARAPGGKNQIISSCDVLLNFPVPKSKKKRCHLYKTALFK